VLIGNNGSAPVLLKNNAGDGHHWLGLKLQGTGCNRDAIGATITWSAGGTRRSRYKTSGGSYLSSHDSREVLGLGTAAKLDWLEIKWPLPSGRVDRFIDLPIDSYTTIVEGKAKIDG
jgi:enediyne biosynthesis protein E4